MTTLQDLEKQSQYCDCPELAKLNELRRELEKLRGKCGFFQDEASEELISEDRKFVADSLRAGRKLGRRSDEYQRKINLFLKQRELYREAYQENISTIHCSRCKIQVEVVEQEIVVED